MRSEPTPQYKAARRELAKHNGKEQICSVLEPQKDWPFVQKCDSLAVAEIENIALQTELDASLLCEFHLHQFNLGFPSAKTRKVAE